jgi:hypothetical protein
MAYGDAAYLKNILLINTQLSQILDGFSIASVIMWLSY